MNVCHDVYHKEKWMNIQVQKYMTYIHTLHDIHAYDWIRERIDQYRGYPPTGFK